MANNIIVTISGGGTATLQATDNTTYMTPAHQIVRSDGTVPLKPVAEDAAHSSGDVGLMMLGVRNATAADLSAGNTDGDYEPFQVDASGRVWVNAGAVTPGTAATSLGKAEDAAHSSSDVGVMMLAVRNATATDLSAGNTDGDYEPLQVDANGCLHVIAKIAATQTLATVTNLATIGTSITPGGGAAHLGKAEDAAHTSGDTGVFTLAVRNDTHTNGLSGTDGDYTPFATDSTGKLGIRGTFAEDAASTSGDLGVFTLCVRNDSDANLTNTDLDYTATAVDIAGRTKVNMVEERVVLDVTPTCDTSAYTAGDVLFDTITCGTVARRNGDVVVLESVTILDEDDQTAAAMTLYFFDSNNSLGTINGAPNISDANARKLLGWVPVASGDWVDVGGAKIACVRGINLTMKTDAASQIIYVAATCAGTPTQTASGIKLKLAFKRS